jgi:hypothetical protein
MPTFQTPAGVQHIRVYSADTVDDSENEDAPSDGEVSDLDEDVPISELFQRNVEIMRSAALTTVRHPGARDDDEILIIKRPTASKIPYKYLHPSTYCNTKDLGSMKEFAQLVDAPGNWEDLHNPLVVDGSAVRIAFDDLRSLPHEAEESSISQEFSKLVDRMSVMLGVHVHPRAETKVIVGGILALGNYDVRSSTDIHFLKNGRNVLATEIKTDKTFPLGEVWYRKSRGAQVLSAMYAHNAATFLFTQKHWKLFVQNRNRSSVLTFPFDTILSPRQNSFLMNRMGPTFLQAITICLLSNPDSGSDDALSSEAIQFASPEPSRHNSVGSLEKPSKKARNTATDEPSTSTTSMGDGCDTPRFKTGFREGKDIYSYVRVVPANVVQKIEEEISAEEKGLMNTKRAAMSSCNP